MLEKLLDEFHPSQPEIARTKALASLHVGGQILTYRWATVLYRTRILRVYFQYLWIWLQKHWQRGYIDFAGLC